MDPSTLPEETQAVLVLIPSGLASLLSDVHDISAVLMLSTLVNHPPMLWPYDETPNNGTTMQKDKQYSPASRHNSGLAEMPGGIGL